MRAARRMSAPGVAPPAALLLLCAAGLAAHAAAAQPGSRRILVAGSVNVDTTVHIDRLPSRGETKTATRPTALLAVGGKGANQAMAVARLAGGPNASSFAGRFGGDAHGAWLRGELEAAGVDLSGSSTVPGVGSGQGIVWLDSEGAATSVVLGGANTEGWPASDEQLRSAAAQLVAGAVALMLQREVPERVNEAFAAAAAAAGIPVLLDAGGQADPPSRQLLADVDYLAPNENELQRLTGHEVDTEQQAIAAATTLLAAPGRLGARNVLVTLGERGSLLLQGGAAEPTILRQAPLQPPGQVLDATAAGDAYRAAFAVALVEGRPLPEAMRLAAAAGAIAVTRMGAMPSLPTRAECEQLLQGEAAAPGAPASTAGQAASAAPPAAGSEGAQGACTAGGSHSLQFASRLNSMKARRDLAGPSTDDVLGWIARQGGVRGLSLVYLNYPEHLRGLEAEQVLAALKAAGLRAGGVALRFPSAFRAGAFTAPQPALAQQALQLAVEGCGWAERLGADHLVVWSAFDGYDYHFQANYTRAWDQTVDAFRQLASSCPGVKVSLEWKPTDASSRFSIVPSTAAALLLAQAVDRPNFGLTLDTGHLLMAGENWAQSVAMVAGANKLFGMHLNDGHARLGAEDGLAFGSVHPVGALEMAYWLRASNYTGHIYFDTFPLNEDPVQEAEYNIRRFSAAWERAARLEAAGMGALLAAHNAMGALELLARGDGAEGEAGAAAPAKPSRWQWF